MRVNAFDYISSFVLLMMGTWRWVKKRERKKVFSHFLDCSS